MKSCGRNQSVSNSLTKALIFCRSLLVRDFATLRLMLSRVANSFLKCVKETEWTGNGGGYDVEF
jgi:hypothetical protein